MLRRIFVRFSFDVYRRFIDVTGTFSVIRLYEQVKWCFLQGLQITVIFLVEIFIFTVQKKFWTIISSLEKKVPVYWSWRQIWIRQICLNSWMILVILDLRRDTVCAKRSSPWCSPLPEPVQLKRWLIWCHWKSPNIPGPLKIEEQDFPTNAHRSNGPKIGGGNARKML